MKTRTLSLSLAIAMVISLVSVSNVNAQDVERNTSRSIIFSKSDKQSSYYQLVQNFQMVKKFEVTISNSDRSFLDALAENGIRVFNNKDEIANYSPCRIRGVKTAYIFRLRYSVSTEDCLDFIKMEKGQLADVQGIVVSLPEIKKISGNVLVQSFSKSKDAISTLCIENDGGQYFWLSRSKSVREADSYIIFFSDLDLERDFASIY